MFTTAIMFVMHVMNFHNKTKTELENMLSIGADLNRSKQALNSLLNNYTVAGDILAALYTQFLISYVRSFASGKRKGLRDDIFKNPEHLAIHKDIKSLRDRHIAHPVSNHEQCIVLAAVPDLSRNELIGLGVRYSFFVADTPEKLAEYRRPLEAALAHVDAEIERLGNQLVQELLGESHTWKSAQSNFWSAVSADNVFGPGAENAMGRRKC